MHNHAGFASDYEVKDMHQSLDKDQAMLTAHLICICDAGHLHNYGYDKDQLRHKLGGS